ncbi:MAG: hypothetical protein Q8O91_07455 [Candidatus Aminicenantes bacterium]|nr:hypothetical protein [Candidatus Aminicenantes bacterium]
MTDNSIPKFKRVKWEQGTVLFSQIRSSLERNSKVKGRAFAAEVDPRAKPGALTRDVNTRLSTAETDPQTKPALIRFANEDCKAWGPCRRPGRR